MKKKIINIFEYIILGILGIIIIFNVIMFILGYTPIVVVSGSMEPEIYTGSLMYYQRIDEEEVYDAIDIGETIIYKNFSNIYVTHEIINIDEKNDEIITKSIIPGSMEDDPITASQVIGIYGFSIPVIGYIVNFIGNIYFIMSLLIVSIIIYLSYLLSKTIREGKQKSNNN